ncbi:MAG TPA: HAD-IC family P-type ATPase [Actinomycetales bacterium]|nr:HAD-IC family P-type ATPase [Actinomycetales bacterium]
MTKVNRFVARYPLVAWTLLVGAIVLALYFSGLELPARMIATGWVGFVVVLTGIDMIRDIMRGHWGLDILAVVAMVATLIVGEYIASIIIVLMLTGGEALEDFAAYRARSELTALLDRAPRHARRFTADGGLEEIAVEEVQVGDELLVRPAEVVPVDGELLDGEATFDEASLTGESLPVERGLGDPVLSGAVNGDRAVRMRATARAEDSQYQRILLLVAESEESKAPTVRVADRFAVPFTVVSLAIAGVAWYLSGDPVRFAEVLVLATPCPLLIAAPVAFLGGSSRAAKSGVIVKGGAALEALARARAVAFDKTGTLSHGRPELVAVRPAGEFTTAEARLASSGGLAMADGGVGDGTYASPSGGLAMADGGVGDGTYASPSGNGGGRAEGAERLLQLAASAEQASGHVLAAGVIRAAQERGLELFPTVDATEVATNGVEATVDGRLLRVGKLAFIQEVDPSARLEALEPGQTAITVAVDGRFAGTLLMRDELRENAPATVAGLREAGFGEIVMLTGDNEVTAIPMAAQAGIERDSVYAGLLPADKVSLVEELEGPVIMVGDGINDAPVLAAADVGIAMGARGSTAASETADVVVMADDIGQVTTAVDIGRHTYKVALAAIWLGVALSLGLMVVAAFGHIPAVVGALTQEIVDLACILYALRALGGPVAKWRA